MGTTSRQITANTSLENLKKEAKRWLKALRAHDEQARERLMRAYPHAPADPGLRDVQHAIALEHGLPGWSSLKNQVTNNLDIREPEIDPVAWFLDNACPDHHVRGANAHVRARHTAMRLLQRFPQVADDNFYTAIVCGDVEKVERVLAEHPAAALERYSGSGPDRAEPREFVDPVRDLGPKRWEPILYLCFTRLPLAAANENAVDIARALLDHGADPNVYFMAGHSRYTPLVGAIGEGEEDRPPHPRRDELVRLLLDHGAEPYDIQVIYNIHFHGQVLWFLKLMYEYSVKAGRQADWNDPDWSMLDMGGYGNGARWHLGIAVNHNDLQLAEWALAHGASPNAPPPSDPRILKSSLHEDALRMWHTEMADLLVRYGAAPSEFVPDDRNNFAAACFRLDRDAARTLLDKHPEFLNSTEVIFAAAKRDRADVVELLLDLGMSPDIEDGQKQRPLHIAAYADSLSVARLLIDRGAEIDPVESNWSNTPLGAAAYPRHVRMMELLGHYSRDIWELTYAGKVERVREVLREEPELAKVVASGHTPLMWLPPDDEGRAMELAQLLLAHGADASLRNKQGETASDRAYRLGMFDLAKLLHSDSPQPATVTPRGPSLGDFEQLVKDIIAAYNSGNPDALARIRDYMGQGFSAEDFRERVGMQLGLPPDAVTELDVARAQFLVARGHGFQSWVELVERSSREK